jgi:putative nucleotidyltransferase with HDIG domain
VGAVSRSQLLLLTDLEQPLLKKMAVQAPGSWEHSRAMANLAEASAAAIGADALLTRVGAYYHDLGKTCQAKYFIENLTRGERSPHEDLEPDVSADAIMAHVVEGTRILREGRVPEAVIEFSYTHHGTSIIEYFWHKCLAQGNPKGLTEESFRYPGVRPRTRETAILMLIDSIEAGARTVDPPTREKFLEMVQRVIFVKMHQGQLDESGLSIADIRMLAVHITDALVNAYHKRIRYPWQDAHDRGEAPLPVPAGNDARQPAPTVSTPPEAPPAHETGRFSAIREENGDVSDTGKFRRQSAIDAEPVRIHDDSKD